MSARHPPDHERALAAHLAGDLSDVAIAGQVARCPVCREKLAELEAVAAELDRAADEERAVLAEAILPDRAEVERRLARAAAEERAVLAGATRRGPERTPARPRIDERSEPRRRSRALPIAFVAAAALVLAFVVGTWSRRAGTAPVVEPPIPLGDGDLACLAPILEDGFLRFAWRGSLAPGGGFEVVVRDASGALRHRSRRVEEPTWTASPDETSRWPREIRFEVHAYDATGAEQGTCSGAFSFPR